MRATSLFVVVIASIGACAPMRVPNDFGPSVVPNDAWRAPLPDTGPPPPPTCGGTPTACADRVLSQCEDGSGCALARCRGTPSCIDHATQFACGRDFGCEWDGTICTGVPDEPCSSWSDSTSCFDAGCTWNDFDPPCVGTASSCASLHGADCTAQSGCHALDGDAGPPDSAVDAGHDGGNDAAVLMCTVTGACSPFTTSSCGFGQTCISNGTPPHCTTSAFTLHDEGETCAVDDDCAWGLDCHSFDAGATFRCTRFCHAGSTTDCSASTQCTAVAYPGSTCLRYCVPMAPTCDIATQNCAAGTSCYVYGNAGVETTGCFATGAVAVGGTCMFVNDCARGASCFGTPGVCRQTCATTTDCTTGACTGMSASHHYCM